MFKEVNFKEININPAHYIGDKWMLISAGKNKDDFNMMTASWGHLGAIWDSQNGKPTSVIYIRPQRYTLEFIEKEDYYALSFFDEEYRKDLAYLGSHSGKDVDKKNYPNLTPIFEDNVTYFKEAKLVLICKKLYKGKLDKEGFIDKDIVIKHYPKDDYHYFYIGEIVKTLINE